MVNTNGQLGACWLQDRNTAFIAAGNHLCMFDLRSNSLIHSTPQSVYSKATDDINCMDMHSSGKYLTFCDDAGEVHVLDVRSNKPYVQFKQRHDNIASCVRFMSGNRPWELYSGGYDYMIHRWNFSNGKCMDTLSSQSEEAMSAAQSINPPFIHDLAVHSSGSTVYAGLGNGSIMIINEQKTKSRQRNSKRETSSVLELSAIPDAHLWSVNRL